MRGLYYEEFEVGRVYKHPFRRTVTEMDNVLFTSLTMNLQPLHLDEEFAKTTIHGRRIFNSLFTLALTGAFHVPELTMGTTLGNLGYGRSVPHPCSTATRSGPKPRFSTSAPPRAARTRGSCGSSTADSTRTTCSSATTGGPL